MFLIGKIFLADVCVVTLGTLRIIFISRGNKVLAPLLGFFEVTIWLYAMAQVMSNLGEWSCFLAFALGFTLGNFLGILIEKRLALGTVNIRIITHRDSAPLVESLRGANFGATRIQGHGASGPVDIIMTVIRRKQLANVVAIIEQFDPDAFYVVDELQGTSAGIFPLTGGGRERSDKRGERQNQTGRSQGRKNQSALETISRNSSPVRPIGLPFMLLAWPAFSTRTARSLSATP